MRTRILYIALATLMLVGCTPETGFIDVSKGGIVLDLYLEDPQTKATREGDADLNENEISNRIDIFFYDETTGQITKEVLGAIRSGTRVQIETNPNDIESIFGTLGAGAHCGLFVVANFAGTYLGTAGSRTISKIKSSLLPAPTWETLPQDSFVMTGEEQVTLGSAQGQTPVYANVGLERVAAKVTFDVTVSPNLEGGWAPDTSNMTVYMVYAMRKATLGAEPEPMPATKNVTYSGGTVVYEQYLDKKLYNTGTTKARTRPTGTENLSVFSTEHDGAKPFYTYPCTWETGSSMEPYMKLIIPWTYNNTTRKYYYKIPFHGNELLSNHWYHISIDVQILGTEQADPPQVDIYYAIADWGGEMDNSSAQEITSITSVPATVITARYLTVPTTEYVLYNENELTIPIQSSTDVEVVGFDVVSGAYTSSHYVDANYIGSNPRIYNPFTTTLNSQGKIVAVRPDYSSATPSAVTHAFTYDQAADADGWSVSVGGRTSVTLTHALKNDASTGNYDVAPYTIRMRIRHKGEGASLYFTDVIVEQRPAIIIKPERNSDTGDFLTVTYDRWGNRTSDWGEGHTAEDGYVFNNGVRTKDNQNSNRSNTNFNMYVIETSVLPTTGNLANYLLGDPRSRTTKTISGTANGTGIDDGSTRTLTNYYEAGDDTEYDYFIAPKFRIASSFGASSNMTRDNAKLRCAAYQEDGYPAGRWRLPTVAEITYMAQLTTDGLIPRLLGQDSGGSTDYWSNSGYVTVADGTSSASPTPHTGTTGNRYVRCVYDEWYWEDTTYEKADKTTFTWGDQLRSAVRKKTHE